MPSSCAGKHALVTGASSGIGREAALQIAREGATVIAVGRDETRLRETANAAADERLAVSTLAVDLTSERAMDVLVAAVKESGGQLDVLVHAAGVFEPVALRDTSDASLDRQWAINVRVPFLLTRDLLPTLCRGSSIIFLSSICGHTGFPESSAYCATKGAIELVTKSLAIELGPEGIRVNCVAPGWIATRMNDHLLADAGFEQAQIDASALGRIGSPADVAATIAHLASDASTFMTGASVHIDGGYPSSPPLRSAE